MPSALILAAGNSGRMGRQKAFLPFDSQQCFLEKIISEFLVFNVQKVTVVLNSEGMESFEKLTFQQKDMVQAVLNLFPERERFYSIQTGLKALKPENTVFLHNVDTPFLHQDVLKALIKSHRKDTYAVPTYQNQGGHPILLSQEVVHNLISTPDYTQNLKVFLQPYTQISVPVTEPKVLVNINLPMDYEKYFGETG